jgi:hypothetical protein
MTISRLCLIQSSMFSSSVVDRIGYLHDVQQLGYLSVQTHLSGILRSFAMNNYHLIVIKVRRFLTEGIADITADVDAYLMVKIWFLKV